MNDDHRSKNTVVGKYWAAIRGDTVEGLVAMSVPADVDFEAYRKQAIACLELVGEVIAGEIIERDGQRYFTKRLTHSNRSKKPRIPKEYQLSARSDIVIG